MSKIQNDNRFPVKSRNTKFLVSHTMRDETFGEQLRHVFVVRIYSIYWLEGKKRMENIGEGVSICNPSDVFSFRKGFHQGLENALLDVESRYGMGLSDATRAKLHEHVEKVAGV